VVIEKMDKAYLLEIVTPIKVVFKDQVIHVKAPGVAGYFGVLYNHAPFLTALTLGVIEVITPSGKKNFSTSGGFCEVMENQMRILVETCESVDEIDVERAERARDRAMQRLKERAENIDVTRAQAALARSLNRLQLVGRN
jgi:F-type H+-transporting ATPase subunit epsilon